jgi:hypothetical protein
MQFNLFSIYNNEYKGFTFLETVYNDNIDVSLLSQSLLGVLVESDCINFCLFGFTIIYYF